VSNLLILVVDPALVGVLNPISEEFVCLPYFFFPSPLCSAVRGLSNYMFFEAQRLAKEEIEQGKDKFDG
jgi:hypothetical protein